MYIGFLVTLHTGRRGIAERCGLVAFLAFHLDMDTGQNETSLGMIKRRILPLCFLVAGFTLRTQLVLMNIVLAVTRNAGCLQLLSIKRLLGNMAFLARSLLVFISKRVTGIPFVVKVYRLPAFLAMAGFALVAEFTLMAFFLIILAVAGDTSLLHLEFGLGSGYAALVASVTLGVTMLTLERILGILVMVEAGIFPALFIVAAFALLAQAARVAFLLVILAVASHAIRRQFLFAVQPTL